jgi:hypothetical protein
LPAFGQSSVTELSLIESDMTLSPQQLGAARAGCRSVVEPGPPDGQTPRDDGLVHQCFSLFMAMRRPQARVGQIAT